MPHYKPIRVIGHGAFGKSSSFFIFSVIILFSGYVFEAQCLTHNRRVALKRTMKAGRIVSREYEVLSMLKGAPNVIQLLDFFYSLDSKERIVQNTVMEYCQSSLEDVLKEAEKTKT